MADVASEYVQPGPGGIGGTGGTGAPTASCTICTLAPATVSDPVRVPPASGSRRNVTLPSPWPSRPATIEIHGSFVEAAQVHASALAFTSIVRSPPAASTCSKFEDTLSWQGLPSCEICSRWSLTLSPAPRGVGSALLATVKFTDPSPCPSAGFATLTHPASLRTDHAHSRLVTIRTAPDPPAGGNEDVSA